MSSQSRKTIQVDVNPLRFFSLDPLPGATKSGAVSISPSDLVEELAEPRAPNSAQAILHRYREVSRFDHLMVCARWEEQVRHRIVAPIRSAKQAYFLGHYLACIALAGTVGEMVTVYVFNQLGRALNGQPCSDAKQRREFSLIFEKLNQGTRLDVLSAFGAVPDAQIKKVRRLADIRNKYLHHLSHPTKNVQSDALRAYRNALEFAAKYVGFRVGEGGALTGG